MRIVLLVLTMVFLSILMADGMELRTTANVNGDGRIDAATFSNGVKDSVSGSGHQQYTRMLKSDYNEDIASLTSTYIYRKDLSPTNGENTHYASVDSGFGIEHEVSVLSTDTVTSTAKLQKNYNGVETSFVANSYNGSLLEKVIDSRNIGPGYSCEIASWNREPMLVAKTYLEGNYSFNSGLTEETIREPDAKGLIYEMDSVELVTESGIEDGVKAPKIYGGVARTSEAKAQTYYDEAIKWTSKAMDASDSVTKEKYLNMALANISDSLEFYEEESDSYPALVQQGNILYQLTRHSEAVISLDKAIKIKRDPYALYQKAANLMELKEFEQAMPILKEVIILDKNYRTKAERRLKTSYEELSKLTQNYPQAVVLAYEGLAEYYNGDESNAREDLNLSLGMGLQRQNEELYEEVRRLLLNLNN